MLRCCGFYARVSLRAFRYVLLNLILPPFVSAKAVSYRGGDTLGGSLFVEDSMGTLRYLAKCFLVSVLIVTAILLAHYIVEIGSGWVCVGGIILFYLLIDLAHWVEKRLDPPPLVTCLLLVQGSNAAWRPLRNPAW
jgi:hypothetical protein